MSQPLLEVKALRSYFKTGAGPARAVDGVSFAIEPGETFAIVGESGSGKSVSALSILKLLPRPAGYIAGGEILFEGRDISKCSAVEMRKIRGNDISMIFQEPMTALNPVFTVAQQITEVLTLHQNLNKHQARNRAHEILEQVGIPDPTRRLDEYPHQLSGGMRQRVMIAIALSCRPKLLIADEPTTALDVTIQAQIMELIKDLRREYGTSVLLITHDMGLVRENADHVGVMYSGKMVEQASMEKIFAEPAHPYTELLLRSLPSKGRRGFKLETIEGLVPKPTEQIPGCRFSNRCPVALEECPNDPPQKINITEGHSVTCHLFKAGESGVRQAIQTELETAPIANIENADVLLEIDNLQMFFPIRKGLFKRTVGHVRAVDGVTLQVRKGETLALVGESGCGKTTVGKCIIRLLDPTDGSILYQQNNLNEMSRNALKPFRKKIQFVFQDPFSSLDPRRMISESLLEGMETHNIGNRREDRLKIAEDLMARVGLDPSMIHRYPHEFSGGQRQRVVLARALTTEPSMLICDEATSSLDISVQAQILNLLKELQVDLGLSYIFITHNLSVVQFLADRVAVMYLGRIVEEGTAEEIFEHAKHPYTQALLSAEPHVDEDTGVTRIVLEGDVPSPSNPPRGCHFHPRCPQVMAECKQNYPGKAEFSETHSCRCLLYQKDSQLVGKE